MKAEAQTLLLRQCVRGDETAWNRLFDEYYEEVFQFFLRQSRDFTLEEVETLCREVFLAAIRNVASYQSRGGIQTWLLRIAMNRGRIRIEKSRQARRGQAPAPPPPLPENRPRGRRTAAPPPPPPPPATPEEEFQMLREALDRMAGPGRDLIELHYFGDVSVATLALEFEMSIRSMRTRLRKCLKRVEELVPSLTQQIADRYTEKSREEDPLALDDGKADRDKSSRHHPVLDRYLREYAEEQDARGPEEAAMPPAQREELIAVVHQGIPRRRRRQRRTEYEDELEEKQLRKKAARGGSATDKVSLFRVLGGLALKLLAVVTVMAVLAAVVFWWLDRMSVRQAEEASASAAGNASSASAPADAPLGVFAALENLTPATNATDAASATPETASATNALPAAPTGDIPPEEQVVKLAALAARVPPNRSGARIEFNPPPPDAQLRKRISVPEAPDMFRRVRIVQTDRGIEITDRWDGSFYQLKAGTQPVAKITEVARAQALELPGVKSDSPAVLVLSGKGTSFTLNQDIQVRVELVLQELPPGSPVALRENDANKAFALWLTHSRLYGEATLENGAKVLFEGVPVKKK
jgi:RNA polymerase sigma-70 factor (ECF subfamily)